MKPLSIVAAILEFSPERFARPGVIVGIVIMAIGLIAVLAADPLSRLIESQLGKSRSKHELKRDDGKMRPEGGSEKDDADKQARKSIGKLNISLAMRLAGALILVAGALTALLCAE